MTGGPEAIGDIEGKRERKPTSLYLDMVGGFFSLLLSLYSKKRDLQCLAADKVGPGADLGGDSLGTGQLLAHALSKELGSL